MKRLARILSRPLRILRAQSFPKLAARISDERFAGTIFCIGDSHISLFTGRNVIQPVWPRPGLEILPRFRCLNIGPALAYNICECGTSSLGRERLFAALSFVPSECLILLSFGEIDCRAHLLMKGGVIESSIERCITRYGRVLREIVASGFETMVYNVPPTAPHPFEDAKYPTVGTCVERTELTKQFNERLSRECRDIGIPFIATTAQMAGSNGIVDETWFMDPVHLSQKALTPTLAAIDIALVERKRMPSN